MTTPAPPEGQPNRCLICGYKMTIEPSNPPGDASCPRCGSLAWFSPRTNVNEVFVGEVQELNVSTKWEAIQWLVGRLCELGRISLDASDEILPAILAREKLGSTGIGRGVAIPHAKHPSVRHAVGIIGFAANGIDFESLDGKLVNTVVLLLSPPDRPNEHLRALAWIMKVLTARP